MTADDLSRVHADPWAATLPALALDRQRVVHAAAFRRLQHKTQVFVAPISDHFRTRLTHTLEVAQLARCLAQRLGLDADLAETVALAHDLGHPPFGHAGERALDECLRPHGGFEHNRHTLRIVEELEHPYPAFNGLNLTRAVRECLAKHHTPFDQVDPHPLQDGRPAPLAGQAVDLADRLTYALHDLQDGLYAGLIPPDALAAIELWRAAYEGPDAAAWRGHLRPTIDRIQAALLAGVTVGESAASASLAGKSAAGTPQLRLADETARQLAALEELLRRLVYRSAALEAADAQAHFILGAVFAAYAARPERLPERFQRRLQTQPPWRVVADYVAGMTDRFCLEEHQRLCDT